HVNCMFREPLAPLTAEALPEPFARAVDNWRRANQPISTSVSGPPEITARDIAALAREVSTSERGLLLAGGLHSEIERKAVLALSSALGWPLLADITSGLRLSPGKQLIPYYDLLAASESLRRKLAPEVVLHLGGKLTSKRLQQFLKDAAPSVFVHVSPYGEPVDPDHIVTRHIQTNIASFCDALCEEVPSPQESDYLTRWQQANRLVEDILNQNCDGERLSEPAIARALSRNLPDSHALFVASSMPIRWLDMYASTDAGVTQVGANRGASGIDGTMATATGYAQGLEQPVTCLTGDLALLHDINSLALVSSSTWPVIVVLFNNNGGHIFDMLPVAKVREGYEQHFVSPHGFRFADAAAQFGLAYVCPSTANDVIGAYRDATQQDRSSLIEIPIDA
ncbi:MAG: 2-succinyl-5-enolpyruvyl-6-hydroxy-3-cyclohexene-1-carboxylate synthase, partial [Candidatus Zixiibacteriota bacterium]